jgi:hypothetical protein
MLVQTAQALENLHAADVDDQWDQPTVSRGEPIDGTR